MIVKRKRVEQSYSSLYDIILFFFPFGPPCRGRPSTETSSGEAGIAHLAQKGNSGGRASGRRNSESSIKKVFYTCRRLARLLCAARNG